jgi:GntR family transcriptional regulator
MADPLWRQIAADLRQKIESGELGGKTTDGKDKPLPTELELQDQYGASRNTIRDAIKWLVTRGLVYTRSGQGTFVTRRINPFETKLPTNLAEMAGGSATDGESAAYADEVESRRRIPRVSGLRVEIQQATGVVAAELEVPDGSTVVSRHQRRFIDDLPYSLQTTFYPMRLVERGATRLMEVQDIKPGAVPYIEQALSSEQTGWRQRITVRVPDATETAFFGLPDDGRVAVFQVVRTGYFADGKPFRVTVTTYPTDRNQFVMTSGEVPDE